MGADWRIVAFPVILPWREEFWTLPLYFPDLKVGVTQDWPARLPYQGQSLPPEATIRSPELAHYQPGDLRQWQAFEEYRRSLDDRDDILAAIRTGQAETPEPSTAIDVWSLAWQLEKMQTDQDAQLLLVDKGHQWLSDILQAETWEEKAAFATVPGVPEMVDPTLAQLRYRLWRRVMAPYLSSPWAPLLLGRTSRALFLSLKGWPEWTGLKKVEVSLPGCRSEAEWLAVLDRTGDSSWQGAFQKLLGEVLNATIDSQTVAAAAEELNNFADEEIRVHWPFEAIWTWDLEIWLPEQDEKEAGPVLCWLGAGKGILPG